MKSHFYSRLIIANFLVILLCALSFVYLDRPIAIWTQTLQHSIFYKISLAPHYFFKAKIWFLASIVGFLVFIAFRYFKKASTKMNALGFLCSGNIVAGLICETLKDALGRYRPPAFLANGDYGFHFFSTQWIMNSMPSGHTAIVFSMATGLTILFRRQAALFFGIAILVSLSRILINQHFLSDVLFSTDIGISAMLLVNHYWTFKKSNNSRQ